MNNKKFVKPLSAVAGILLCAAAAQAAQYEFHFKQDGIESPISSPVISAITPSVLGTPGGDITVTGSEFLPDAVLTINGTEVPATVVSETEVFAQTGAHDAGFAQVALTNTDSGTATVADQLEFKALPQVTSLAPTSGLATGGTSVRIDGAYFTDDTQVYFDGELATVSYRRDDRIDLVTPAVSGSGAIDVKLVNSYGETTLADAFSVSAPTTVALSFHGVAGYNAGQSYLGTQFSDIGTLNVSGGSGDFTYNWKTLGHSWDNGATWLPATRVNSHHMVGFGNTSSCSEIDTDVGPNPKIWKNFWYSYCRVTTDSPWYNIQVEVVDNVTGAVTLSNEAVLRGN